MNRMTLAIIGGVVSLALLLVLVIPVLLVLFLFPLRAETVDGPVNNNPVPSNLEARAVHDRLAIQLTWTGVAPETWTYRLQRTEAGSENSWDDLTELHPGSTSYLDDTGLRDGVTYLYRIHAWNPQGGSGNTNVVSAVATMLPAPGGPSQEEWNMLQADLDANIEKWQQSGLTDYEFEFRVNCFCPTDITAPVTVKVMDTNSIDSITYSDSGLPVTEFLDRYPTVGGMFDMIQEAIDNRVARLTVTYDSELGYPTEAFIDQDFLMADEERGFTTSKLQVIETPTLDEIRSQLDASRQLWESEGPESYRIEYQRICFCPEDIRSPVVVAVNDGAIASRTYVETGQAVGEAFRDLFIDVPGLFEIVQDAIDQDADRIRVKFDSELGYPTSINIDYSFMMADEEVGFAVRSFR